MATCEEETNEHRSRAERSEVLGLDTSDAKSVSKPTSDKEYYVNFAIRPALLIGWWYQRSGRNMESVAYPTREVCEAARPGTRQFGSPCVFGGGDREEAIRLSDTEPEAPDPNSGRLSDIPGARSRTTEPAQALSRG